MFNPKIVLDKCPASLPAIDIGVNASVAHGSTNCNSNDGASSAEENEVDFEGAIFLKQFEEEYDLYNPKYVSWLKINHPYHQASLF